MIGYRIQESNTRKEIGVYPQCIDADYKTPINAPNFIGNVYFQKTPKNVVVPDLILRKSAKITDLLSAPIVGYNDKLVVSQKLANFLMEFNFSHIEYIPIKVIHQMDYRILDYYVLNFTTSSLNNIDFEKSEILGEKRNEQRKLTQKPLPIHSVLEFKEKLRSLDKFGFDRIFINRVVLNSQILNTDLFALTNVSSAPGYFISTTLKKTLDANKFSGIDLIPSNVTLAEWLQG
jgi:hypothetical protein